MAGTEYLMGVGLAAELANRIGFQRLVDLDGNGTTQVGAAKILATNNAVQLQPSVGNTAFVLDETAELFQEYFVVNGDAETALVYPPPGGFVDDFGLNAAVPVIRRRPSGR